MVLHREEETVTPITDGFDAGLALVLTGHVVTRRRPRPRAGSWWAASGVDPQRLPQLVAMRASEPSQRRGARDGERRVRHPESSSSNLGPCEFMPRGAADVGRVETGDCARLQVLSGHAELFVGAEVHLPNGVLVDQITIFYRDTSPPAIRRAGSGG